MALLKEPAAAPPVSSVRTVAPALAGSVVAKKLAAKALPLKESPPARGPSRVSAARRMAFTDPIVYHSVTGEAELKLRAG